MAIFIEVVKPKYKVTTAIIKHPVETLHSYWQGCVLFKDILIVIVLLYLQKDCGFDLVSNFGGGGGKFTIIKPRHTGKHYF